jgi:hypothetical protein
MVHQENFLLSLLSFLLKNQSFFLKNPSKLMFFLNKINFNISNHSINSKKISYKKLIFYLKKILKSLNINNTFIKYAEIDESILQKYINLYIPPQEIKISPIQEDNNIGMGIIIFKNGTIYDYSTQYIIKESIKLYDQELKDKK